MTYCQMVTISQSQKRQFTPQNARLIIRRLKGNSSSDGEQQATIEVEGWNQKILPLHWFAVNTEDNR